MPYPVLPPDPPPIVYTPQSEDATAADSSHSSLTTSRFPAADAASQGSSSSVSGPELTATSPPEVIPSEPSLARATADEDPNIAQDAASLGPSVSVGLSSTVPAERPAANLFNSSESRQPRTDSSQSETLEQTPANRFGTTVTALFQDVENPSERIAQTATPRPEEPDRPSSGTGSILEIPTDPLVGEPVNPSPPRKQKDPAPAETAQPPAAGTSTPVVQEPAIVELTADRQEYDVINRIFTAEGDVLMRYAGAVLDADQLRVNLFDRIALAEGNAALTRGEQVLRGSRFEYNFVQGAGTVLGASGVVYVPTASSDLDIPSLPTDIAVAGRDRPPSDRITAAQPVTGVVSPGQFELGVGVGEDAQSQGGRGDINRLRFEAEQIDFTPNQWTAQNVRITNDPFSPPELELRADEAVVNRISPLRDEIVLSRPRLVFDQGLQIPLLRNRIVIDRRERDPGLLNFGYDEGDRGGLFVQGTFNLLTSRQFSVSVTPQVFLQRAFTDEGFGDLDSYGLIATVRGDLSPTTFLTGRATFTSLDSSKFEDELRASLRLTQVIGTGFGPHNLSLEYSYRDRLFNGSLGFQDIQESYGAVLTSPSITLGNTGINLSYQVGAQYINADTDRPDLLEPIRTNNRVNLGRFQASAALSRGFLLWQGQPLPPTPDQGLRYTPNPIVPYLQIVTAVRGTVTSYSNGDSQNVLSGTVGLQGQFGHFSRPFLDYTAFGLFYSDELIDGDSPFLFDRDVDQRVLRAELSQQLYGPFRLGLRTSYNLDTGEAISTDYILEYSRRTYGITLRYNPEQEIGSLNLRISDFNWSGGSEAFGGSGVSTVEGGVIRSRD